MRFRCLNLYILLIGAFLLLGAHSHAQPAKVTDVTIRLWTDVSGTYQTKAELIELRGQSVRLKKTNGVEIEVPFSMLSEEDVDFLAELRVSSKRVSRKVAIPPVQSKFRLASAFKGVEMAYVLEEDPLAPAEIQFDTELIDRLPAETRIPVLQVLLAPTAEEQVQKLERLRERWPPRKNATLLLLVRKCAVCSNLRLRNVAREILQKFDPMSFESSNWDEIDSQSETQEVNTSVTVSSKPESNLKTLGVVGTIANRLNANPRQIAQATSGNTDIEETQFCSLLNDPSEHVRFKICQILAAIGSEPSLKALKKRIADEENLRVRLEANEAIFKIQNRLPGKNANPDKPTS